MRYFACALVLAACARAPVPPPASPATVLSVAEVPECYALSYSDPTGGATVQLFPTWIALLAGARADGGLPEFLRQDAAYKQWRRLGGDSLWVKFTSTAEGIDLELARHDSSVVGRAIWLTDLVGQPEASMRVVGIRESCPSQILSAK